MPANPLQELAHEIVDIVERSIAARLNLSVVTQLDVLPRLTQEFGTLLQAERAATLKPIYDLADKWADPDFWKDTGNMMDSSDCAGELLNISEATPADASALAAVVQRETQKWLDTPMACGHAQRYRVGIAGLNDDEWQRMECDDCVVCERDRVMD